MDLSVFTTVSENSFAHCAAWSYTVGTVTCTGISRSRVVNVVPPADGPVAQHTRFMVSSSASSATQPFGPAAVVAHMVGRATPQDTVRGGSPYAAFCSGPALTLRGDRSRTFAGSCDITARQTDAARAESFGAGICTAVDGTAAGVVGPAAG